jgi:two-component system, cell cycle response regulator DivK
LLEARVGNFSKIASLGRKVQQRGSVSCHLVIENAQETEDGSDIGFTTPTTCSREAAITKRILLVEDQEDNRQIVRDLLSSTEYDMIEAGNGEEAVAAASKERPDLILMDIQLPLMDGYDATRHIKADPSLCSIPIIAVTSYALSGDEEKALAAGCNDVVSKPYSPRQLLAKIRKFLP